MAARTLRDLAAASGRPFTVAELAEVLGVSQKTVRRLVRSGTIAAFRCGRPGGGHGYRIPFEAVRAFIASRLVQPTEYQEGNIPLRVRCPKVATAGA